MKKRNIYLLYAISLLQGMIFYGPVATLYRQAAGISVFQITLIESISVALMILLEVPWGRVADRIGYRRTMIFCCFLYVGTKVIFWRAASFWGFLSERILLSVVLTGLSGVDVSVLYLSCEKEQAQRVFGIYNDLQHAGMLLAAVVHGLWIGSNYRLAGFCTVISYAAAALLSLGLQEVRREDAAPVRMHLGMVRSLLGNRSLLLLLLSVALLNETHQTITVFLGQLKYVQVGMSDRMISAAFLAVTLAGMTGRLSDRLTRRLGERRFGSLLFLAAAGACCLLVRTRTAVLAVAGILLLRMIYALFQPLQTNLQNRAITVDDRATALSLHAILLDSTAIFTNLIFGRLADHSLSLALGFGAVLSLTGLALYRASWKG